MISWKQWESKKIESGTKSTTTSTDWRDATMNEVTTLMRYTNLFIIIITIISMKFILRLLWKWLQF